MGGKSSRPGVRSEPEEKFVREEENLSLLTASGKATLDIAITGVSGAGKSSLVNALRGVSDFDEAAARTDVIEVKTEPVGYPHPTIPDVIIWDLPGIGTPNFKAKQYLERVNYSQYDFFIIVASNRFTAHDIQLSHAIKKLKKQFYYVRSKMDVSISNEKLNPAFNEEATLQRVRKYCVDNLVEAGISSPKIFLISSWFPETYDFPLLKRSLENEIEALRRRMLRPAEKSTKPSKRNDISFILQKTGKATLDIAITGVSGAGKSSLVNALRGVPDFDEAAARTDVIEVKAEPVGYPHPTIPDVIIWDLPGIGTPKFKAEQYLERVNYSQYDFFLIVASNRFTVYDIQLSHAIKRLKKQFYFVWSKMDVSISNEKLNPAFNEETALQRVRKYCVDNLVEAGISSPKIFLTSSWYPEKYDFPLLQRTLENETEALRKHMLRPAEKSTKLSKGSEILFILLQKALKIDLAKLKDALRDRNPEVVAEEIEQELDELQNVRLDIAITGVSGSGKSSLVNALRGMTDYEEGAAEVGITQTTMECCAYPHPLFPNVTIWDLPGIGTPEFRPQNYLKKVNFTQYDFFMIVSSERFTENDVLLAHEIQKMKKKFYFVRSKMDVSIAAESRDPNFNLDKSIQNIRKACCHELTEAGESDPRVFLISRRDLSKFDFSDLQETLENDLDDLKRHALILSMPLFSRKILKKKMDAMQALI
ncbi:uncharacterized protein LOC143837029 [Paroedura picta]|uniref:uncharacterized protein LOC143837029 n=1 Tax=Paroedura picta TaxID=143630 RepID=UPI004056A279